MAGDSVNKEDIKPGSLLTYNAPVYARLDNSTPWHGEKALLLEMPMSDVLGPNSILSVLITGKCNYAHARYFEELVTHYGWGIGE